MVSRGSLPFVVLVTVNPGLWIVWLIRIYRPVLMFLLIKAFYHVVVRARYLGCFHGTTAVYAYDSVAAFDRSVQYVFRPSVLYPACLQTRMRALLWNINVDKHQFTFTKMAFFFFFFCSSLTTGYVRTAQRRLSC